MTKLEQLIKKLCPNGVEYKALSEICDVSAGGDVPKEKFSKLKTEIFNIPIISNGIGENALYGYTDKPKITKTAVTVAARGTIGYAEYRNYPYYPIIRLLSVIPKNEIELNPKFLYYCLSRKQYKVPMSGIPQLTAPNLKAEVIPVPPMEVQSEIVKILDEYTKSVTSLQQELEKELTARKKQYEYYRDLLLDFGVHGGATSDCERQTVGELFEIRNGLNKEKEAFGKGKPIINFTDVYKNRWLANGSFSGLVDVTPDEIERYSARKGDIFFTRTSETKEDIGMSSTLIEDVPDCVFSGFVLRARPTTDLLLPKFCAYYFSTHEVRKQIVKYAAFTTRATTTGDKLSKIKVPIPSIKEQERIVSILDRFDKLCNDISEGLPAEIEARRKQYEYYRDKLLSFKSVNGD